MFSFEHGDYKYIFEYDTPEELEKYIETMTNNIEKIEAIKNRHFIVHKEMGKAEKSPKTSSITWSDLEIKFITAKKKLDKVSKSTYKAYESTFNKLKDYFKKTKIDDITIEDYEEFRDYLMDDLALKKKTVNNHMAYVNLFLEYGVNYKFIEENNVKGIESLKEDDSLKKENFTDEDIKAIFSYDYPQNYKDIFVIAAYTGMRVSEIIALTPESIKKEENDIYYFDIVKSKTQAGIRKVPIHKDILERVLQMNFPLMDEKSDNASQKAILRQLYKVIDKESTKTFHTFRGTFMSKCQNQFPDVNKILLIQEIVGHSKGQFKLTVDGYGHGFILQLKKEIVDSVAYSFE